jgi:hypothetical protein
MPVCVKSKKDKLKFYSLRKLSVILLYLFVRLIIVETAFSYIYVYTVELKVHYIFCE